MKNKIMLSMLLAVFMLPLYAKKIDIQTARSVAKTWYQLRNRSFQPTIASIIEKKYKGETTCYMANYANGGFTIISGDDNFKPILAYSFEGSIPETSDNPMFNAWIDAYSEMIANCKDNETINKEAQSSWSKLISEQLPNTGERNITSVPKRLFTATWGQGTFYNTSCPEDTAGPDGHVLTGCVATAMGILLHHHKAPLSGQGEHTNVYNTYGTLHVNYGDHQYNWDQMPSSLTAHNKDVADLLYHCGVAVDMKYGPTNSGNVGGDGLSTRAALEQLFGMTPYPVSRYVYKKDYTNDNWVDLIRSEIDANRPAIYFGPGHAWICEGYDDDDRLYMNWGWNGHSCNGYFSVDSMQSDNCTYSKYINNQSAIIGLEPECPYHWNTWMGSNTSQTTENGHKYIQARQNIEIRSVEFTSSATVGITAGREIKLKPSSTGFTKFSKGITAYLQIDERMDGCSSNSTISNNTDIEGNKKVGDNGSETSTLEVFPNPLREFTTINYTLQEASQVLIEVYDLMGQVVKTPVPKQYKQHGNYSIKLRNDNLAPGTYLIKFVKGDLISSKQIVVLP